MIPIIPILLNPTFITSESAPSHSPLLSLQPNYSTI